MVAGGRDLDLIHADHGDVGEKTAAQWRRRSECQACGWIRKSDRCGGGRRTRKELTTADIAEARLLLDVYIYTVVGRTSRSGHHSSFWQIE